MDKHTEQAEVPSQPEKEMDENELEQVAGGFDPQPEPPALMQKGTPNPLLKKVQKGLPKISGDPIGG